MNNRTVIRLLSSILLFALGMQPSYGRKGLAAVALDSTVEKRGLWLLKSGGFIKSCKGNRAFFWNDSKRQQLCYVRKRFTPELTFIGEMVYEGNFFFDKQKKLQEIELYVFNRGDAGWLKEKAFTRRIDNLKKKLDFFCGGDSGAEKSKSINGRKLYARLWTSDNYVLRLSWSSSGRSKHFYAEFIKINIFPKSAQVSVLPDLRAVKHTDPAQKVKTNADSDKYLEVPMTDQGGKAYCVASTIERIMKYYGSEADQHLIAQLAKSSSFRGTSLKQMVKAMDDAENRLKIKIDQLYLNKTFLSISDMRKTISRYNKIAKKMKMPQLEPNNFIKQRWRSIYYHPYRMLSAMDVNVYRRMRCEYEKREFKNFIDEVKENIDKAVPLAWSVVMGIVPEDGKRRNISGHMRLIIGYNDSEKKIIYSDSWGRKHEFKKMSYEDAWTISSALFSFEPRGRR